MVAARRPAGAELADPDPPVGQDVVEGHRRRPERQRRRLVLLLPVSCRAFADSDLADLAATAAAMEVIRNDPAGRRAGGQPGEGLLVGLQLEVRHGWRRSGSPTLLFADDSTPTSSSQAPDTINTNEAIIPKPTT